MRSKWIRHYNNIMLYNNMLWRRSFFRFFKFLKTKILLKKKNENISEWWANGPPISYCQKIKIPKKNIFFFFNKISVKEWEIYFILFTIKVRHKKKNGVKKAGFFLFVLSICTVVHQLVGHVVIYQSWVLASRELIKSSTSISTYLY